MAESKGGCEGGCLTWVLLLIGFFPGVFIAMKLPEGGQFTAFVISIVTLLFCGIKVAVYKKPEFEDETFGHACKRFMWEIIGGIVFGVVVSLGYFVFGGVDKSSNASGDQPVVEQSEVAK